MTGIVVFKEKAAARYGLPSFQRTLSGEVLSDNVTIISIIPFRCAARKVRNIDKKDLLSIEIFK